MQQKARKRKKINLAEGNEKEENVSMLKLMKKISLLSMNKGKKVII